MTVKRFISLALASACFILPESVAAETLTDAVIKALQTHPTIEAAQAVETRITEEREEQEANFFPELNTTATGARVFGNNATSRGLVTTRGEAYSYLFEGSVSLTQPLFDGFETFNRVDAASARLEAQKHTVTDARQNLGLRAVQAFLNVMRTREALFYVENYRETLKAYQDRINLMVAEGAADEAEAAQAKNISLLLQDSLVDFQGQVEASEAEYIEIVGQLPETELEEPVLPDTFPFAEVEEAVEYAKANHPQLLSARKALEAAGFESEAEEGTLYPDFDGELSYLKRDQREEIGGELEDGRALIRMNWRFSTGGGDLARIRQTKAEYSEALANMQVNQREIVRDVRRSFTLYETAQKQAELLIEREKVTAGLFETFKVQFEGARVSLLQLMQTENQLFNTQLEAVNTKYQHMAAYFALLASMGDLLKMFDGGLGTQPADIYGDIENASWPAVKEPSGGIIEEQAEIAKPQDGDAVLAATPHPEKGVIIAEPAQDPAPQEQPALESPVIAEPLPEPEPEPELEKEPETAPKEQIYPLEDYQDNPQTIWP